MLIPCYLTNLSSQNNTVQPQETSSCFLPLLAEQEMKLPSYLLHGVTWNKNITACFKRGTGFFTTVKFAWVPKCPLASSFRLILIVYSNSQELWVYSIALVLDVLAWFTVLRGWKNSSVDTSYKISIILTTAGKNLGKELFIISPAVTCWSCFYLNVTMPLRFLSTWL